MTPGKGVNVDQQPKKTTLWLFFTKPSTGTPEPRDFSPNQSGSWAGEMLTQLRQPEAPEAPGLHRRDPLDRRTWQYGLRDALGRTKTQRKEGILQDQRAQGREQRWGPVKVRS